MMDKNRRATEETGVIVSDAVSAMAKIEKSSNEINVIISVIGDIAFQTNLLALNAGVEAARAGEAGRGFAVVATEVRQLSQRATDSAQQIKDLILSSNEHVSEGSSLVNKAGEALLRMVDQITAASDQIGKIASATKDQSQGLRDLSGGVAEIDSVTQSNAAIAQETSLASSELRENVAALNQEVVKFRTESGSQRMRATA
jgi:methyl-accepting chemotaxis protein